MSHPHVLLITTDHWPANLLGVAGHPVILSPTLDQLARSGTRFTNAYSECPVCIPARRTLMTGTTPRTHGDRVFKDTEPMPGLPTLAQSFRDAGYQAQAVGKLHVFPQRDRIGFDDVILDEEGRTQYGVTDDYETALAEAGFPGRQFAHGMSNNEYSWRPWHLPDEFHPTNWAALRMAQTIRRRDPTRPGFWYLSFRHPHPPLTPLQSYLEMYGQDEIDEPFSGPWAGSAPYPVRHRQARYAHLDTRQTRLARRAFYALCTHIDHAIRLVVGTLREEGILDDTIICFSSDHGDMLGNHGTWAKRLFYEGSANVPLIVAGASGQHGSTLPAAGTVDDRIVGFQDIMPTLLSLAEVPVPESLDGISAIGEPRRESLYGEFGEEETATRMIRRGTHKLIYYPTGNRTQLFDLEADPEEREDQSENPEYASVRKALTEELVSSLYGGDLEWLRDGTLAGLPEREVTTGTNKGLSGQRGIHWPPPPQADLVQSAHK